MFAMFKEGLIRMEQLRNQVNTAVMHIEEFLSLLIIGRNEMADRYVPVITRLLNDIIPKIIKYTGKDELSASQDSAIWVQLLKNVIDAMESDDGFVIVDAYKDMVEMLRYYLNSMEIENG